MQMIHFVVKYINRLQLNEYHKTPLKSIKTKSDIEDFLGYCPVSPHTPKQLPACVLKLILTFVCFLQF